MSISTEAVSHRSRMNEPAVQFARLIAVQNCMRQHCEGVKKPAVTTRGLQCTFVRLCVRSGL